MAAIYYIDLSVRVVAEDQNEAKEIAEYIKKGVEIITNKTQKVDIMEIGEA